jgi:hypothetical protein
LDSGANGHIVCWSNCKPPHSGFWWFHNMYQYFRTLFTLKNQNGSHTILIFTNVVLQELVLMCMDKYFFCRVLNETHYYVDRDLLGCDTPTFMINMLPLNMMAAFLTRTLTYCAVTSQKTVMLTLVREPQISC